MCCMQEKVILITGASRGIGFLTAKVLAEKGHQVYATMRTPDNSRHKIDNLFVKELDVTKKETVQRTVNEVISERKRIDVLINNAGYGLLTPVDMATEDEIQKQFDVNVFGALRVIQKVLPHMRKQKEGQIINISSIAGLVSNPALGLYCATKHALEAISASLAVTVSPWNISVSVVQPAATSTEFAEGMPLGKNVQQDNPYGDFSVRYFERMKNILSEGQPAIEVAELIADIVDTVNPHFRYQTSKHAENIAKQYIVDPSGDQWLKEQKKLLSDWFPKD